MLNPILTVHFISPQQVFYSGPATSVSSKNYAGTFDILAEHANFISIVENQEIIIRPPEGPPLTFKFPLAIIHTTNNEVNIYTYIQPEVKDTLKQ